MPPNYFLMLLSQNMLNGSSSKLTIKRGEGGLRRLGLYFVFMMACVSLVVGQVPLKTYDTLSNYKYPDFKLMDTSLKSKYPFIRFERNNFKFYTAQSTNWDHFYKLLDTLIQKKDRRLNMYHIGGSHLQADIYTHDVRTKLQTTWEGVGGDRSWVFPFDLARTNNPWNYTFKSPNSWKSYRSVLRNYDSIDYCLLGAMVKCTDSVITIHFEHDRTQVKQCFNLIRVFHNKGNMPYDIEWENDSLKIKEIIQMPELGYTDLHLWVEPDYFDLKFARNTSEERSLEIYGFQLLTNKPGISYTAIGINGAGLYTYLDCKNFEEQLKVSPPDFFAFSVGTNDGNVPYADFKPEVYKRNLELMMQLVWRANPKCAILLTVPNDSYYRKKYLNRNIAREREMMIELAKQYEVPIWDLYGIMGELGSSKTWFRNRLMKSDLIHFTADGYHLKGDLYFDAFLKWMDQMKIKKLGTAQMN